MLGIAIAVAAIALPDSINPSLILGALYLAAGAHPKRRTAAFTAAAFAVTFAGGVVFALGLGDLILSILPKPSPTLKYSLLTGVGAILIVGGVVIWLRRESLSKRESSHAEKAKSAGGSAALLGAGIAGVELLTAIPYFAAITLIVGSSVSTGGKLGLLLLYNIIYALPLFAIVLVCFLMGDRAEHVLTKLRWWVLTRWPLIVAPLAVGVGIALAAYGIVRLA